MSSGRDGQDGREGEALCPCAACSRSRSLTALVEGLRESAEVKGLLLDAVLDLWALQRVPLLCVGGFDEAQKAQKGGA